MIPQILFAQGIAVSGPSPLTVILPSPTVSGNGFLVEMTNNSTSPVAIQDNGSNAWVQAPGVPFPGGGEQYVFYCLSINGRAGHSVTVTGGTSISLVVRELNALGISQNPPGLLNQLLTVQEAIAKQLRCPGYT